MLHQSKTSFVRTLRMTNNRAKLSPNSTLNSRGKKPGQTNFASCAPVALSTTTTALNIGHKISFVLIGANFGHIFEVPTHGGGDYFEGVFALVFRPCNNLVGVD